MSPAKSESQQRAAGMALSAKKGETPASSLKGAALDMYNSMTVKQLEEYAKTVDRITDGKHKGKFRIRR